MNNWIIGIVALAIVFFLVKRGYKLAVSVFIIATALMAIFLLDKLITIQPYWLIGVGVLWLLVAVVVLKTARENGKYVIPFILIAAMAITWIAYFAPRTSVPDTSDQQAKTETKQETTAETTTLASFNPDFVQVASDNTGNKVDATWEASLAKNLTSNGNNYDEATKLLILQKTSSNAQLFAIWANAAGLYGDPNNWQPLVKDNKLTAEAQNLWWQFAGVIKTAKVKQVQANSNGVNTGVENGSYGAADGNGISGNLTASEVALANGDKMTALERCGNFVLSSKPSGLPTVPTDNPPAKGGPPITPPNDQKNGAESALPQGNAPEGEGLNEDTGAGEYKESMPVVPEIPYVAPVQPVAVEPTIPEGSEPDDYVPTVPEVEAPTPEKPAVGEVPVPGIP